MQTAPTVSAHRASTIKPSRSHLLSAEPLADYQRDGFIVPGFSFSSDEVSRLRALVLKLVADNPTLADSMMNCPHVPGSGTQGLTSGPGWMEFAAHPKVVDIIEQIIGPDIILRGSAVFYKRAS